MILIALLAREASHIVMSTRKARLLLSFEHSLLMPFWTFPARNMMAKNIMICISTLLTLMKKSWQNSQLTVPTATCICMWLLPWTLSYCLREGGKVAGNTLSQPPSECQQDFLQLGPNGQGELILYPPGRSLTRPGWVYFIFHTQPSPVRLCHRKNNYF